MAKFIGRTPAQAAVGQIIHDGIIAGKPSARIMEQLADAGLINENYPANEDKDSHHE